MRTTSTRLYGNRAFIVISSNGPTWHHGYTWSVHEALPMNQLVGGARRHSVGPCLHRGTSPFWVLANLTARNHADRIQF